MSANGPPFDSHDDPGKTHFYGDDCDPPHVPPSVESLRAFIETGDFDVE